MEILMWLRDIIALNLPFFSIIGSSAIISASYLPGILKIKKRRNDNKSRYIIHNIQNGYYNGPYQKMTAKISPYDIKKLDTMNYPKELASIIATFKKYVEPNNLNNCIRNLQNLTLKKTKGKERLHMLLSGRAGCYSAFDNLIALSSFSNHVISHEFLHMCSAQNNNLGFLKSEKYPILKPDESLALGNIPEIGRGLNEGYTELLNQRIFKYPKRELSYHNAVNITKMIELLFDNPKEMENAYFNADLDAVIHQFRQYGTRRELLTILNNLDDVAAAAIPGIDMYKTAKTELMIYNIIKRTNDPNKIKRAESIMDQNKLAFLLRRKLNMKLQKNGLNKSIDRQTPKRHR